MVPGWKAAEESSVSEMPFQNTFFFWPREKKLAELKQQVVTLKSSIAKEEERVADLKLKVHLFSSGESEADDQDKMLTSLNKKVLEVYCQCTGENEANLETMEMLMVIEKQLNDLLDNLERIPPAKIEQAEKAKKKERMISTINLASEIRLIPFGSVTQMKFPFTNSKDATGQLLVSGHPQVNQIQQRWGKKKKKSQTSDISLLLTLFASFFTFVVKSV
uniref:Uncharacterized protein n=1 Tax=Bubo bubo TaxID=30461 RepID=A0A8C0EFF7_BUBBB